MNYKVGKNIEKKTCQNRDLRRILNECQTILKRKPGKRNIDLSVPSMKRIQKLEDQKRELTRRAPEPKKITCTSKRKELRG